MYEFFKMIDDILHFALGCLVYLKEFLFVRRCRSRVKLNGKTAVITGGNTGIGKETARDLAARGARVIIACRDTEKGNEAVKWISTKVPESDILVKSLDLSSFASIRAFAEELLKSEARIDLLVNNAGVGGVPKSKTEDGFELQFGVNHLGHFLLTNLLLNRIKASSPSRIVNVASAAHYGGKIDFDDINLDKSYHPISAYCRSKLCNILFTRELAKRLKGTGVTTYCLHPGAVHTGLGQHLGTSMSSFTGRFYNAFSWVFFKSPRKGAQTVIYCTVDENVAEDSGLYYCDCTALQPSAKARNDTTASKLWEVSEELVNKTQ